MERPPEGPMLEKHEAQPQLLCKIILMRHEETEYTGVAPDLTEAGIERAAGAGQALREEPFFDPGAPVQRFASPKERAQATAALVSQGAGWEGDSLRTSRVLGQTKILDAEAFARHIAELDEDPERIAEAHHTHAFHRDYPELVETHSAKKRRLFRAFEYLLRGIDKREAGSPPTQVFAVSHYELITHLIDDVFGIQNTGYRSPGFGEQIRIAIYATEDSQKMLLKVAFRGEEREVAFDRTTRTIEPT